MAEYSTEVSTTPQVSYLTTDHLGSPRVITDQGGNVTTRKDYTAFGEENISAERVSGLGYSGSGEETRKGYTGYEKDGESGLDFAQARYYNSMHGRFTSIDPLTASASIRNPQTFNRYSYVLNSPYKYTDPLGLLPVGSRDETGLCGAENSDCDSPPNEWHEIVVTWNEDTATTDEGSATATHESAHDGQSQQDAQQPDPPPAPSAEQNAEPNFYTDDPSYNCMAWALGIEDQWIAPNYSPTTGETQPGFVVTENRTGPGTGDKNLLPPMPSSSNFPLPKHYQMADIAEYYGADKTVKVKGVGKEKSRKAKASATSEFVNGKYKLVVFQSNDMKKTHVMRQDADGSWSSKNGEGALVRGIQDPVAYYQQHYNDQSAEVIYFYRNIDKLGSKK